ncbi:hypothetical protein CHS0354_028308 [Potamilus streckersoni]|uniref:Uncharacterized protein n=1 Tax=Potamilus streckersoni TaxID=2493646 RepID=A0AAE0RUE0_9BIVA|nr:hypothetical protein CHS0354_028308 [Potamilus streckersoni]
MAVVDADIVSLGNHAFCKKDYGSAAEYYSQALESDLRTCVTEVLKKRCHCYFETGDYPSALQDANTCLERDPDDVVGYIWGGKILTKMKQFENALGYYKKGLEIDPKNAKINDNLKRLQEEILYSYGKMGENMTYSTLKMSSQEAYPGDDQLAQEEMEILKEWKVLEFPSITVRSSDPKLAEQELSRAKEMLKTGNMEEVNKRVVAAIEQDTTSFDLWREVASLLHKAGNLKHALQFVNVIPEDFRSNEAWKLGGKILAELGIPITAENWLRQAIKRNTEDDESMLLFQNVRVKRLYDPLICGAPVQVQFTKLGRSLIAKEERKSGQTFFQDCPVILSQTLDSVAIPACGHCAKCLMRPEHYFESELLLTDNELKEAVKRYWPIREIIYCSHCDRMKYCSEKCKNESWKKYHKVICSSNNGYSDALYKVCDEYSTVASLGSKMWSGVWNASYSPMIMAHIWASIICEASRLAEASGNLKPTDAQWALSQAPYRRFIAYGSSSQTKIIPKMFKIMQDIFHNLSEGRRYTITEREFDGRYFQATCNVQAFSDFNPPFKSFINAIRTNRKYKRIESLCTEEPREATFAGLFPLHACLNHSCINNVEVLDGMVDGKPGVTVRARMNVKPGDELFTTYIDSRMPKRERRAWLFRAYNFWCNCLRCEFEGDDPRTCTHCYKMTEEKECYPTCDHLSGMC